MKKKALERYLEVWVPWARMCIEGKRDSEEAKKERLKLDAMLAGMPTKTYDEIYKGVQRRRP